jgi:hypothetical protein
VKAPTARDGEERKAVRCSHRCVVVTRHIGQNSERERANHPG